MSTATKAKLLKENAALRQRIAELEKRLAPDLPAEAEAHSPLFEAVLENIPIGMSITGGPPDFPLKWVSRAGLQMTQRPADALVGLASGFHQVKWGLLLADGVTRPRPEQMPLYRASRLGEVVQNEEFVLVTADQRHLTVLVDAAPIRDAQGNITGAINSWRDITERKHTEEALRQARAELEVRVQQRTSELTQTNAALQASQATLQGFYDSVSFMMGIAELEGGKSVAISANRATAEFLAVPLEELPGRTGLELGHPEDFERLWVESYQRCQREGVPVRFEYEYPHAAGKRWLEAHTAFIGIGDSGNPRFSYVAEDITERKHAEEKLRENEERFRAIYEYGSLGIAMGDLEGRLKLVNPAFCALLGYAEDELLRMNFRDFTVQDDISAENMLVAEMLAGKRDHYEIEKRYIRKDGKFVWVTLSAAVLQDSQCVPISGLVMVLDITERKRLDDVLQQLNVELENRVSDRTAEIKQAHRQLRTLSRQLIEAQENERRKIGRELHDEIGQTLTGLKILMGIALRLPAEDGRKKITQAQTVAGELIDLVSALSLNLRPPMLDDLGLLPTLLWFVKRYTLQTNIRVDFQHEGLQNRRFASTIETAVYRLTQESLTNIARHSRATTVSIRIVAVNGSMELTVEDEGAGFDVQAILENNDTGGLSGMRERVRLLEGSFEIDSTPGHGTRIFIRLPLKLGE